MIPSGRELAEYTLARQHPLTRTWLDDAARLENLSAMHEGTDVVLAADPEIAAARIAKVAPGTPVRSMLNHWVQVGADQHAMFSMRFEGMDPSKPFVDASTLSRALEVRDLAGLAAAAVELYGVHKPPYLRLWSSEPVGAIAGTEPDRRFLAAPIEVLREREVPAGLALTPANDLRHYEEAQEAYDAVDRAHPRHVEQASMSSREVLQESADEGLLFNVEVDGVWAGYSAALDGGEDTLGLSAYIVQDVILAPGFRGRGLGASVSTLLARALSDQSRVLIGTIHANNKGALHAATHAGRVDVGGWLKHPL